ncbi:MAG: NAD(P)/FAD-dependent oxidoreductase, partial [Dehalococcoidia bacterium]
GGERGVLVVGGGFGVAPAAFYLARAGRRVALIEKGVIAGEASGRNGGHVQPTIEGAWGPLGRLTLDIWPHLSEEIGYPTEYRRCGGIYIIMEDDPVGPDEIVEFRRDCGFAAEAVDPVDCARLLPGVSSAIKGGVVAPNNGHANPILTTKGLAKAAQDYGAEVWSRTRVERIDVKNDAVVGAQTSRGYVSAPFIVNAAGPWAAHVGELAGVIVPVMPRRIEILLSEAIPPYTEMVWGGNGIYARQAVSGQLHFGAGGPPWEPTVEYYDKTVAGSTMQRIARRMVELVPGLAGIRILRSWAGVIGPTADGTPIVDLLDSPKGFVIATGFAGNGFVTGPATGKIVSELILEGSTSTDIDGMRLSRFGEEPEWMVSSYNEWWNSPLRAYESGAWAVEGVRAVVETGT